MEQARDLVELHRHRAHRWQLHDRSGLLDHRLRLGREKQVVTCSLMTAARLSAPFEQPDLLLTPTHSLTHLLAHSLANSLTRPLTSTY